MYSFCGNIAYTNDTFMKILNENKNHLIDRTNWDNDLKDQAKEFFTLHPEQESELGDKWNNPEKLSFEKDIQPIVKNFNSRMTKSKLRKQTKQVVKKSDDLGDYIRAKNKNDPKFEFDLVYSDDEFVIGFPLTWETCVYLDSFEDFGKGAKWCIGSSEDATHWDTYVRDNVFLFIFTKYNMESISLADSGEDENSPQYKANTNLKFMIRCFWPGGNTDNLWFETWDERDNIAGRDVRDLKDAIFGHCLGMEFITSEFHNKKWRDSVENRLDDKVFNELIEKINDYKDELPAKNYEEEIYHINNLIAPIIHSKIKEFVFNDIDYDDFSQENLKKDGNPVYLLYCDAMDHFNGYNDSYGDLYSESYVAEEILDVFEDKYNNQPDGFTQDDLLKLTAVQKFLDFIGNGETENYGSVSNFIRKMKINDEKKAGQKYLFKTNESIKQLFKDILDETMTSASIGNFTPERVLGVQSTFGNPIAPRKHLSDIVYAKDTDNRILFENILKTRRI
jgi:hypothetical protein